MERKGWKNKEGEREAGRGNKVREGEERRKYCPSQILQASTVTDRNLSDSNTLETANF